MGIKYDLWPDKNGRYPPTLFTLTNTNKNFFLRNLKNIKVPNGYSTYQGVLI